MTDFDPGFISGREAMREGDAAKPVSEEDELRARLWAECEVIVETLIAKRADYGTRNIALTGRFGLAVRMQDKVSRLLNLTKPEALPPTVASESITDTYRDLAGYALIGLDGKGWDLE